MDVLRHGSIVELDLDDGPVTGVVTSRSGRQPYFVYGVCTGVGQNRLVPQRFLRLVRTTPSEDERQLIVTRPWAGIPAI